MKVAGEKRMPPLLVEMFWELTGAASLAKQNWRPEKGGHLRGVGTRWHYFSEYRGTLLLTNEALHPNFSHIDQMLGTNCKIYSYCDAIWESEHMLEQLKLIKGAVCKAFRCSV